MDEVPVGAEEMAYIDDEDLPVEDAEKVDEVDRDAVSVATEAVDGLSIAPTELLANEYRRLMDQYE